MHVREDNDAQSCKNIGIYATENKVSEENDKETETVEEASEEVSEEASEESEWVCEEESEETSNSEQCDEESEEEIGNTSDEDECSSDDVGMKQNIMFIINSNKLGKNIFPKMKPNKRRKAQNNQTRKKKSKYEDVIKKYNSVEKAHFESIDDAEKDKLYLLEKGLENDKIYQPNQPLRFKVLKLGLPNSTKNILLSKIEQYNKMMPGSGEYCKLGNWLSNFSRIPIDCYHELPIKNGDSDIEVYLKSIKSLFDQSIFGHHETKEQIIRILAQWISNPSSGGYVIGIQGDPGVGKTKLIKTCICNAMKIPLAFVSLGGISDSSYLNGHHYTYEGATYGKIVESLIKSKVMNPVFLFDELDKVSNTSRGEEIINTLIHITDPVQNDKYTDKYFEEIDLDISKSLIIFTYNDVDAINPILKDRMITINVPGYSAKDKMIICKDFIIPESLPKYNMKRGDIVFDDALLKTIIERYKQDSGVRNIKRTINDVISWVNMMKYIPTDGIKIEFPFHISLDFFVKYCDKPEKSTSIPVLSMYT